MTFASVTRPAWELGPEDRDQLAGRVFAVVLEGQLAEFTSHEAGVRRGDDPEELHDYRIALRRARSLLSAGGSVYPAEELELLRALAERFATATSTIRDLDVLIEDFDDHVEAIAPTLRDGAMDLLAELRANRALRHKGLVAEIDGDLHATLLRRWQTMATVYRLGGSEPGPDAMRRSGQVVDDTIRSAVRSLRKAGKKARRDDDPARWHKVRKRLKRVRYLITLFGPLYEPGTFDETLRRMRKLQNRLGALQDSVAQPLLIAEAGGAAGGRAGLTAGAMCQVAHDQAGDTLVRCEKAWETFDRPGTWKRIERALDD